MLGEGKRATQHRTFIGTKMRGDRNTEELCRIREMKGMSNFFCVKIENIMIKLILKS